MKRLIVLFFALMVIFSLQSQNPSDSYDQLKPEFHKNRRDELRKRMPSNSVAVFFANPIRNRANDVSYMYHQDPNFLYLSGHKEPHALLLIFKEKQHINGEKTDEILFVRSRNALAELYDGPRLDKTEVNDRLSLQTAFESPEFKDFNIDFSSFDKVLFYDFFDDIRDTDEAGDLFDLVQQFKEKVGYTDQSELTIEPKKNNLDLVSLNEYMKQLRGIKTTEEVDLLRKAVNISAIGQSEVMKAMRPGMSETEVQGMHEYIFKKYQSEYEGYPSIVGAGHNGCVLHYIDNYKAEIEEGELILMDLGAEYHGYTADVTRTIPVNGVFSPEQRQIYELVLKAQEAAMDVCKAGVPFSSLYQETADVINKGLVSLGLYKSIAQEDIINPETGRNRYYPHGCCHHIGLDVHDLGTYDILQENMVITIEPGIYIPENSQADPKWWDIPVRIEDDYLVTKEGCELLSDLAPRHPDEIEALMKQESAFHQFSLPDIDGQ